MKLKNTFFAASIFSGALLLGCKTQPQNSTVSNTYIGYLIRYSEDGQSLRSDATFKRGDSLQVAKPVAILGNVSLNGQPLNKVSSELGEYYTITGTKEHPDSNYTFSYNDPYLAKITKHTVFFPKATDVHFEGNALSMKNGGTLIWNGAPLRNREEIMVQLEDSKKTLREIRIVGPTQKASFALSAAQLDGLTAGEATINCMRTAILPLPESQHTKGSVTTEYYAKETKVKMAN
ncbi:MAG: hypothetical protein RI894_104 [Bacteroidota bacterium]|jgi:hypothetical protein